MILIPYLKINYTTKLKDTEIKKRLTNEFEELEATVRQKKKSTKPYQGAITYNSFIMKRIINYRNSFLPIITGDIRDAQNGSTVNVTMKLPVFSLIFIGLWVTFALFMGYKALNAPQSTAILRPILVLAFGYIFVQGFFGFECSKSKKFLNTLLEAE